MKSNKILILHGFTHFDQIDLEFLGKLMKNAS